MVRKFMKNKKIIIPILILIVSVIVIGLFYKVNTVRNTEVTIEYAEGVIPSGSVQNEDTEQRWETLNEKTDNKEFRELVNKLFWITEEEQTTGTLASLISDKPSHYDELRAYLSSIYTDIDEDSPDSLIQAAAINNYFNIYDDSKGEFNGGAYLSRTQYMAGVARAIMPVSSDIEKADKVFIEKVGEENRSNIEDREVELASTLSNQSYLRGKNVTAKVYGKNSYISRVEAIYLLVNLINGNEEESEVEGIKFSDCKDGGNISEQFRGENKEVQTLAYCIEHAEEGLDSELYEVMKKGVNKGIIERSVDTRWDEPITKAEALNMIAGALRNTEQAKKRGEEIGKKEREEEYKGYKEEMIGSIQDSEVEGARVKKENAKASINEREYDESKTIEENKGMIEEIANRANEEISSLIKEEEIAKAEAEREAEQAQEQAIATSGNSGGGPNVVSVISGGTTVTVTSSSSNSAWGTGNHHVHMNNEDCNNGEIKLPTDIIVGGGN